MSGPSQSPPDSSFDEATEEGFILVRVACGWRGVVLLRRSLDGAMLIAKGPNAHALCILDLWRHLLLKL